MILNNPMSPALSTCVPPQSSIEKSPIESTRTSLSYFSPNSDIAPAATAASSAMTRVSAGFVATNRGVDQLFDAAQLLGGKCLAVREIESQPIRRDQRALLLHVFSEHFPQRRMQQMRRGVIEGDGRAALGIDCGLAPRRRRATRPSRARRRARTRRRSSACRAREAARRAYERAGIPDLAAALRVERRVIEHHLPFLARPQHIDDRTVENQRRDAARAGQSVVAGEIRLARQLDRIAQVRAELARGPARGRAAPPSPHRSPPDRS